MSQSKKGKESGRKGGCNQVSQTVFICRKYGCNHNQKLRPATIHYTYCVYYIKLVWYSIKIVEIVTTGQYHAKY